MEQPPTSTEAVSVGRVLGLHGTAGQVRLHVLSDDPHRFDPEQTVFCNERPLLISSSAAGPGRRRIIGFEGVDSPEAASALIGEILTVPETWVAILPEGEYFHFQLLGMKVVTDEGELLGEIAEVIETGSNDVYVVNGEKGQLLIPAIGAVVQDVKVDIGLMVVHLMDGMR